MVNLYIPLGELSPPFQIVNNEEWDRSQFSQTLHDLYLESQAVRVQRVALFDLLLVN